MSPSLELQFHEEMLLIYERAKRECHYNASRFLQMVTERGGLETAKYLVHAPNLSDGFTALWQLGRVDLTVEAVILKAPWNQLFNEHELTIARKRLSDLGYSPPEPLQGS